jgi:hypothetical protein
MEDNADGRYSEQYLSMSAESVGADEVVRREMGTAIAMVTSAVAMLGDLLDQDMQTLELLQQELEQLEQQRQHLRKKHQQNGTKGPPLCDQIGASGVFGGAAEEGGAFELGLGLGMGGDRTALVQGLRCICDMSVSAAGANKESSNLASTAGGQAGREEASYAQELMLMGVVEPLVLALELAADQMALRIDAAVVMAKARASSAPARAAGAGPNEVFVIVTAEEEEPLALAATAVANLCLCSDHQVAFGNGHTAEALVRCLQTGRGVIKPLEEATSATRGGLCIVRVCRDGSRGAGGSDGNSSGGSGGSSGGSGGGVDAWWARSQCCRALSNLAYCFAPMEEHLVRELGVAEELVHCIAVDASLSRSPNSSPGGHRSNRSESADAKGEREQQEGKEQEGKEQEGKEQEERSVESDRPLTGEVDVQCEGAAALANLARNASLRDLLGQLCMLCTDRHQSTKVGATSGESAPSPLGSLLSSAIAEVRWQGVRLVTNLLMEPRNRRRFVDGKCGGGDGSRDGSRDGGPSGERNGNGGNGSPRSSSTLLQPLIFMACMATEAELQRLIALALSNLATGDGRRSTHAAAGGAVGVSSVGRESKQEAKAESKPAASGGDGAEAKGGSAQDSSTIAGGTLLLPLPLLLVRAGATPPLLRMLHSTDSETQRHAARALANILSHGPSSPPVAAAPDVPDAAGGGGGIIRKPQSEEQQRQQRLRRQHELECRQAVLRHGGLAQLMIMARSTGPASAELQLLAAKSLASMSKMQSLSSSW